MSLPKLMTPEEVAQYLNVSIDSLNRWRANFDGPAWVKVGGRIAYPESSVADYITSQLTGTAAQAMQAALTAGSAERRAANAQRRQELQQIDREDRESIDGVTPLVMGFAGQAPGIVKCDPFTGKPIGAQTIVTDIATGRSDTTVAMSPVQHGVVPVPGK